jgi:DNA-nicking Smr family endonuclease
MDFGDILDAWDRQTGKGGAGKTRANSQKTSLEEHHPEEDENKTDEAGNPLSAWLSVNGVYDKDTESVNQTEHSAARRRRLLAKKPDDEIDLHGLTQDEAQDKLETFFANAKRENFEKLLIIHGKGNHSAGDAVLKNLVRGYIERCPFAGENGHGSAIQGGAGATWVLLKEDIK